MKFTTVLMFVALAIIAVALYRNPSFIPFFYAEPAQPLVTFNQKTPLRVTVVSDEPDRVRGLSNYGSLSEAEGMLFVFPTDGYYGFWMKDMQFSIDIIWVSAEGKVVHIEPAVRPDTYPRIFEPLVPARYVIETNANFAESFSIKVGDSVDLTTALRRLQAR